MTMPVMEPDLDAVVLRNWARAIDDGPFASLCWGERIAFDNPETLTLMGALAAWTDRVRLATTVIVPQLHDPVMLAKASVGLGVHGSDGSKGRNPGVRSQCSPAQYFCDKQDCRPASEGVARDLEA
jgi:Luciferase-like monooxygenase